MGATPLARRRGLRLAALLVSPFVCPRYLRGAGLVLSGCLATSGAPGRTPAVVAAGLQRGNQAGRTPSRPPDFEGMARQQAETDQTWRTASAGFMEREKITYRSTLVHLEIPAFVFQPLKVRGPKRHPAI